MTSLAVVLMRGISVTYPGGVRALSEVDLAITQGEMVVLLGPTGHGKSTLLKLLYREVLPTSGEVIVLGTDVSRLPGRRLPALRRRLGLVFQDIRLLPRRTAAENVAFALHVRGFSAAETKAATQQLLTRVGMEDRAQAFPFQLSIGEQQKVALARALAGHPSLLLADEPTGDLDPASAADIAALLEESNRQGATLLVATHNQQLAARLDARLINLRDGRLSPAAGETGAAP
jgi:cell division transport system ATP-binding protein